MNGAHNRGDHKLSSIDMLPELELTHTFMRLVLCSTLPQDRGHHGLLCSACNLSTERMTHHEGIVAYNCLLYVIAQPVHQQCIVRDVRSNDTSLGR